MKTKTTWECNNPSMASQCLGHEECLSLDEHGKPMPLKLTAIYGGPKCPYNNKCSECSFGTKKTITEWPRSYRDGKEDHSLIYDFFEEVDSDFNVGGQEDGTPAAKIVCKKCGTSKLEVGFGDWAVVLKCPKCKWEHSIETG